jgi:hypothetical protein
MTDQHHEPLPSSSQTSGAEELRQARLEIVGLRVEAARLALQVDDMRRQLKAARSVSIRYSQQISAMRGSLSWRVTLPLRLLRRRSIENSRAKKFN